MLDKFELYVRQKEKGKGGTKCIWAVEMNEEREFNLKLYGGVDKLDQMLKDWGLRYVTWRWWHALLAHGQAIAYTKAWQMYRECASGLVDPRWKVDKPMTCQQFCQRLAEHQVKYRNTDCKYPGDEQFQSYTKLRKKRREKRLSRLAEASDGDTRVSYFASYQASYETRVSPSLYSANRLSLFSLLFLLSLV